MQWSTSAIDVEVGAPRIGVEVTPTLKGDVKLLHKAKG